MNEIEKIMVSSELQSILSKLEGSVTAVGW